MPMKKQLKLKDEKKYLCVMKCIKDNDHSNYYVLHYTIAVVVHKTDNILET